MKIYSLSILLIFVLLIPLTVYPQPISVKIKSTGNICGNILEMTIENKTDSNILFKLSPFYLFDTTTGQALVVHRHTFLILKPDSKNQYFIKGFSAFCDKDFVKKNYTFNDESITKYSLNEKVDFSDSLKIFGDLKPEKFTGSRLISLDFIPLVPGTNKLLGYKFDLAQNPVLASKFLISQLNMIEKAYDKAYYSGKVVSHYNNDPLLEKDIVMQLALWLCTAGMEGKSIKKKHIIEILEELYETTFKAEPETKFSKNSDTYIRLLDKIGNEAKVYIRPENLDRRVKGIPESIGINPTSDNIRTPTLSKTRYPEYLIRNQTMLGPKNDCMPCVLDSSQYPSLRNFLYIFAVNTAREKIIETRKNLNADLILPVFNQNLSYFDGLKSFNPKLWLSSGNDSDKSISLMIQNIEFYFDNLLLYSNNTELLPFHTFLLDFKKDYLYLFKAIAELYMFNQGKYSFDCCNILRKADESFLQISKIMESFFIKNHSFLDKVSYSGENYNSKFFNEFLTSGTVCYSEYALLILYKMLSDERQTICFPGPFPSERLTALNRINEILGINLSNIGTLMYQRLTIIIDEYSLLEFRFGECTCGKKRESLLPFPQMNPGKYTVESDNFEKIDLLPKFEISAYAGRYYPTEDGASEFDGGGLSSLSNIDVLIDSFFKIKYSEKYYFTKPDSFKFDWFSVYGFALGYDVNRNFQVRINLQNMTGLSLGKVGFHYFTNPLDSNSIKNISSDIYTKLNAWQGGIGARYYFLNNFKPFIGLNAGYQSFSSNITKAYVENVEIIMNQKTKQECINSSLELGFRYYFNQDFFIEASGLITKRFIKNNEFNLSVFDKGFSLGAGAKF